MRTPLLAFIGAFIGALITGVLFGGITRADTPVHGFTIPTVPEEASSLRICTTTQTSQWENLGSSNTQTMVCPNAPGTRRFVSLEEAVEAAALLSESINFAFDSAILSPESRELVQTLAIFFSGQSAAQLTLVGHADAVGPEEYNFGLSERRAAETRLLFTAAGVDPTQISTTWSGETNLLVDTPGPELRNRRVEITISQ